MKTMRERWVLLSLCGLVGLCAGCGQGESEDGTLVTTQERLTAATQCVNTTGSCFDGCRGSGVGNADRVSQCHTALQGCLQTNRDRSQCQQEAAACLKTALGEAAAGHQAFAECLGRCKTTLDTCAKELIGQSWDFVSGCLENGGKCWAGCPRIHTACAAELAPEKVSAYVADSINKVTAQVHECIKSISANVSEATIKDCAEKMVRVIYDVATPPCAESVLKCHQGCLQQGQQCLLQH